MEIKMTELSHLAGWEQAQLIREKKVSPVELAEEVITSIEKLNPVVHAYCTMDFDGAREAAREAEKMVMKGEASDKPLLGVPFGVKDMICTKGVRTTFGSKAYENYIPEEDDVAVDRLKKAGAIMIGKTNTPEFAYDGVTKNKIFPETLNPWDLTKTCGGSSGGSAVAAATGMTALTLGNDGGGSVRIPTAFCGVYGIKPTFGRVPLYPGCRDPKYPGGSSWETLEAIGPITRSVKDAALMLSVMSGPHPMDRHSFPDDGTDWLGAVSDTDIRGMKIAYWKSFSYTEVDYEVAANLEKTAEVLRSLGAKVDECEPPITEDPGDAFWGLVARDSDLQGMKQLSDQYGDEIGKTIRDFANRKWSVEELISAHFTRQDVNIRIREVMKRYDLILTPTLLVPAFDLGLDEPETINGHKPKAGWTSFTFPFNLTGQPAATIPSGFTRSGLPTGAQLAGRSFDEFSVLRASAALEAAMPWKFAWESKPIVKASGM